MSVRGHSAEKYVTGKMLSTSSGRRWSNILAETWSHAAGELAPIVPRDTEIAFLLKGETIVERRGAGLRQQTHARPGTLWLCPAGIREEYINAHHAAETCLHIFLPSQPFADAVLQDLDIDPARVSLRYEAVAHDPFIGTIAHQIHQELVSETSAGPLLMDTLGLSLCAYLVQRYSATDVHSKPSANREKPLDLRRLSRVMAYIESQIESSFSVADLAGVACMSPAHFARSFKVATGQTPQAFVSGLRLERAKQMLSSDSHQMADIALASGFSSQSNFARAFRKAVGMTPSNFRTQVCGLRPISKLR